MQKVLKITLLVIISVLSVQVYAQNGTLKGIVKDQKSGEVIIGASVYVEGVNTGASTDLDGKYTISLKPGVYTVVVSYISYKTDKFSNIKIEEGKTTTLNPSIVEDVSQLGEVTIVGIRETNSEVSVIAEVKEAEQVVSAISAEQISKSQDRDAAQVMTRVPGITVIENRFVIVRGLSERYNTVMINDAISPSTEADKRSFSFDLIPSNMLDRMLVMKSGSADMPGDFAGGLIKIYTKNMPDRKFFEIGLSSSYRQNTSFNNFLVNKGGMTDALGYDNGLRSLPGAFPASFNNLKVDQVVEASQMLPNNFNITESKAPTDVRFNVSAGNKFQKGDVVFGNVTSLSYTNTFQYQKIYRARYLEFDPLQQKSEKTAEFVDDEYDRNIRVGLLHNWALIVKGKHFFDFKNTFNQNGINETTIRNGISIYQRPDDEFRNYSFRYNSRTIYSSQLNGKHVFNNDKTSVKWTTGLSYINNQEPDFRRFRTVRRIGSNEPYQMIIPPGATTFDAARFYSNLTENTIMNSSVLEHKFGKSVDSVSASLKVGYYVENKEREYNARWMSYIYPGFNNQLIGDSLSKLPIDQIFSPDNIKAKDGFRIAEGTNPSDKYSAQNYLRAGFASLQLPSKLFDINLGTRVEHNTQALQSATQTSLINVNNPILSPLPFANIAYKINKKHLVRGAYSKTVNRPEFREIAPFLYYNFALNFDFVGNPNLQIATIHNLDVRWEFYPTPSETINFGVFYKRFNNPIETYIRQGADNPIFTYDNGLLAVSQGVEAEVRKSFYTISESKFIQALSVVFNASLIQSHVDLGNAVTSQDQTRIMQGQSPYILNTGIYYNHPEGKSSLSIMYNVYGKRIFTVGDNMNPTIYEMPRHLVDLTYSKRVTKGLELKIGIQDLLNYQARFTQDSNLDGKITKVDEDIFRFRRGTYLTIGLNWRL
jgi:hypothetical protein